jgi:hypothetical protein
MALADLVWFFLTAWGRRMRPLSLRFTDKQAFTVSGIGMLHVWAGGSRLGLDMSMVTAASD